MRQLIQNSAKMSNRYIPHTPEDIALMLERIGVKSVDDLYVWFSTPMFPQR